MARQKPNTQREMIEQVWYAVMGTNGEGLVGRMEHVEAKIDRLSDGQTAAAVAKPQKQPRRMEILTGTIAALVGLQTFGAFDFIREFLRGWLQNGGA